MKNKDLTNRERQILSLILKGKNRKVISLELAISVNTLDKHLHHLHIKTETRSNSDLIIWAIKCKGIEDVITEMELETLK